jgi:AbrB family looped-hinge helix DNA binding protein
MLATVTTKGQVTIPKNIRDRLNIRPNDRVDFVIEGDRAVLVPVKTLNELRGAVPALRHSTLAQERRKVRRSVADRVLKEMA